MTPEPPTTEPPEEPRSAETPWMAQAAAGLRELGPVVGLMGLASLTLPAIVGFAVLGGSAVWRDWLGTIVERMGAGAPWIVGALFAVATGSALAPTYALSAACGIAFGSLATGGTSAMVGVVGGAVVGYLWGVTLARGRVMAVIGRHERAATIRRALVDRGFGDELLAVTLIRFPPNSPFALTNFFMSSTGVRPVPYIVGTAVGMAPRTLVAVWAGTQVEEIAEAKTLWGKAQVVVGLAIAIVCFVAIFRLLSRWANAALAEADASTK